MFFSSVFEFPRLFFFVFVKEAEKCEINSIHDNLQSHFIFYHLISLYIDFIIAEIIICVHLGR
jgi:hypothetical protein